MGNFIIAIFITVVTIPVTIYISGNETTFFRAFVRRKTVAVYYYFCRITDLLLVTNFQ